MQLIFLKLTIDSALAVNKFYKLMNSYPQYSGLGY